MDSKDWGALDTVYICRSATTLKPSPCIYTHCSSCQLHVPYRSTLQTVVHLLLCLLCQPTFTPVVQWSRTPQENHRAGIWVVGHSLNCSDTDGGGVVFKRCVHSLSTLLDTPTLLVHLVEVRDDSSSAAAQCSVGHLLVLHQ